MFASIRRYRMRTGSMDELASRIDVGFAEEICAGPGFVSYEFVDCGDGEVMTISIFRDQASGEVSDDVALQFVGEELGEFDIERTEVIGGEVIVSRAMAELLEAEHA